MNQPLMDNATINDMVVIISLAYTLDSRDNKTVLK